MTMTVDEALAMERLTDHPSYSDFEEALQVLAAELRARNELAAEWHADKLEAEAEVERLRTENKQLLARGASFSVTAAYAESHPEGAAEIERLQKVVADQSTRIDDLNKENDDWHEASQQLREEAQTSRLALDVAMKEVERLKGSQRKLVPVCPDCNHDTADHDTVEGSAHCRYCGHPVDADENPKPGAAT